MKAIAAELAFCIWEKRENLLSIKSLVKNHEINWPVHSIKLVTRMLLSSRSETIKASERSS